MNKIIRIFVPFIFAFLFISMLIWLAGASNQALASETSVLKWWVGKELAKKPIEIQSSLLVTTLEDELNTDGDCSLREAIQAANTNTSVDACGTGDVLTDTITFNVTGMITVNYQLLVNAGGPLVIDGGEAITVSGGGTTHIWFVQFSEFTLQSLAIVDSLFASGGGLYKHSGNMIVNNCTFSNNIANNGHGGGISNMEGSLRIIDSVFSGNIAQYPGGGIYNRSTMTITNSTFSGNIAGYAGGGLYNEGSLYIADSFFSGNNSSSGGGIYNTGLLTITMSTLSGNSASNGGGIYTDGTLTLTNVTLWNNSATGVEGSGGGIANSGTMIIANSILSDNDAIFGGGIDSYSGTLQEITNSTLSGNSASYGGGIFANGTLTLTNSTLSDNSAVWQGGGIINWDILSINNSTLSGNNSDYIGGGIDNFGTLTMTNSTLSDNRADYGGGIQNDGGEILILINSILSSNIADYGGDCSNNSGTIIDGGHNIDTDNTCSLDPSNGSLPNTDPLLGLLQDNGGPTWTYALPWNSPAIDAGDDVHCPYTDQRGMPRPLDGNNDGVIACDIGAYECKLVSPAQVIISGPSEGLLDQVTYFTATVEPISTTLPLTYTWQASGHPPITHTVGLSDTVSFSWDMPGTQLITVTASNPVGSVMDTHVITITAPLYDIYLPLVIKSSEEPIGYNPSFFLPGSGVLVGLIFIGVVRKWKVRG